MLAKIGKIVAIAIVIEILSIAIFVVLVGAFGPREPSAAQAFAERLGVWVGPLSGFILCVFGGWWFARRSEGDPVANGLGLGVAVAVIDVVLLVASGAPFQMIFAVSNVGRMVAGALGGMAAARSRQ